MIVVTTVEADGFYTEKVCDDRTLVPGVLNINAVSAIEFLGYDELEQVRMKFDGIPIPKNRRDRAKYFGDTAKFLIANWSA